MVLLVLSVGLGVPGLLSAGVDTAWVRRYDGPAHGDDRATRIAVDTAGNVYVTGASMSDTGSNSQYLDFVTIKYLPNGDTAWVRRQDFGGKDIPYGLGVDAQGNVYVTGANNDSRMATVKYSPSGVLLWSRLFGSQGGAFDLALDSGGHAVVCGTSYRSSVDRAVIKYLPNGDTAWVRYYDWAGYEDDARAIALGPSAGIATTGAGYNGGTGSHYVTVTYDSTGTMRWASAYSGPADWNIPEDVVTDLDGDVYVAGSSQGTLWDYLTIKYDSLGETLWTRRYDGPAHGWDKASAVAVDSSGNAYVTGFSTGDSALYDYTTVKYSSSGQQCWVARYDGPGHLLDEAKAIAVMSSGDILVTGYADDGSRDDCTTIMYDSAGHQVWLDAYNSGNNDAGSAIALGPDGSFYVAGGAGGDLLVIKYAQKGVVAEENHAPVASRLSLVAEPSVFRSRTSLNYSVGNSAKTRLLVFDTEGRHVRTLANGVANLSAGTVTWDGRDVRGVRLPPGVYMVVLEAGGQRASVKAVVSE